MAASTLLEQVLEHAAGGRFVFPLHYPLPVGGCSCGKGRGCKNAGKHPAFAGWQEWATQDPEKLRAWWRGHPRSNIGMPTGAGTDIAVLDVDPRHGGDDTLARLESRYGKLPETVESLTGGGGRQVWFRFPEGLRNSVGDTNNLGPGLDIRGKGGLVVLPGSLHPSGRTYEWEASSHPDEVPLAEFPVWLLDLLLTGKVDAKGLPVPSGAAPEKIREGGRNNTLASLAGTMRRRGMTATEMLPALLAINQARCDPPLDVEDVEKIAASIGGYAPSQTRELRLAESKHARIVGEELSITPLRVSRGQPPVYTATVRGKELRLSSQQLLTFRQFQQRCMESLDFIPTALARFDDEGKRLPPGAAWLELVNEALDGLSEEMEPPEDASPEGAIWQVIREFLTTGGLSEDRAALNRGSVVIEGDYYLFRGQDLRRHLTLSSVDGWTPHTLWLLVRDHGGDSWVLKVSGKPQRVWRLPAEAVAGTAAEAGSDPPSAFETA